MRLYRYAPSAGAAARLAVAVKGATIDLLHALAELEGGDPDPRLQRAFSSTEALIEGGPDAWSRAALVAGSAEHIESARVDPGARRLAPLRPASLRDFLAFEDHVRRAAARRGSPVPDYWHKAPVYYKGNHRSVIGPDEECPWPSYTHRMDFELELAMVIGAPGRDVAPGDAHRHIFGFTILNDFSARDIQAEEMSAWLGPAKGKDFANALGPCIVTADELGAETDLAMVCRVNGDEWGRARSADMRWTWADMIAHVSQAEDVLPGDVYGSGTPGGCCGLDLGRELHAGDVVELEVESIGVLRNTIGAPLPMPSGY